MTVYKTIMRDDQKIDGAWAAALDRAAGAAPASGRSEAASLADDYLAQYEEDA